jgi:uncharacterized membrane protein
MSLDSSSSPQAQTDARKVKLVRLIILSGWVLTLGMMLAIIGTTLVLMSQGNEAPETLKQWGGVALGFLFGSFSKIIADYVGEG